MLEFLNQVTPLVSLIANMRGQKQASQAITRGNVPTEAETQQNALYQALLDPNSPLLRRLAEQDRATNLEGLQSGIRERQLADRREVSMGRAPTFFNPERADEAVSFLTSRGLPQMNALAQEQAQNRIIRAATGYSSMQPAQQGRLNTAMQQGVSNASYGSQIPPQILEILKSLGQSQGPQYDPRMVAKPAPYGPQLPIVWRG